MGATLIHVTLKGATNVSSCAELPGLILALPSDPHSPAHRTPFSPVLKYREYFFRNHFSSLLILCLKRGEFTIQSYEPGFLKLLGSGTPKEMYMRRGEGSDVIPRISLLLGVI